MRLKVRTSETNFGRSLNVPVPDDCDVMIVCARHSYGLVPICLMLPHQLYRHNLETYKKQYPDADAIVCVPARSAEYAEVFGK